MIFAMLAGILAALFFTLPLAWKWQLGMKRVGLFVAGAGVVVSLVLRLVPLALPYWVITAAVAALTIAVATSYLAYRFYRDPERSAPGTPGAIVSPADGTIIYIKKSEKGQMPVSTKGGRSCPVSELLKTPFCSAEGWVIGISMSFLDVHVNRAPIRGCVAFQQHFPGNFGSLRLDERILDNERSTTIFQNEDLQVAAVQIASRLVRQIASYVKVGDDLALGQRFGVIRLGSQVDLIVPAQPGVDVSVKVGDHVTAGETVLANYRPLGTVGKEAAALEQPTSR